MPQIFAIEHHGTTETDDDDREIVYCWGRTSANKTVAACMRIHPDEAFTVRRVDMTEEEFDDLPEYEGDCE